MSTSKGEGEEFGDRFRGMAEMVWQRGSGYMELIGRRKTGRPQRIVGCSEGG